MKIKNVIYIIATIVVVSSVGIGFLLSPNPIQFVPVTKVNGQTNAIRFYVGDYISRPNYIFTGILHTTNYLEAEYYLTVAHHTTSTHYGVAYTLYYNVNKGSTITIDNKQIKVVNFGDNWVELEQIN